MSETTPSQPPGQPATGLRLRPPGSAPSPLEPDDTPSPSHDPSRPPEATSPPAMSLPETADDEGSWDDGGEPSEQSPPASSSRASTRPKLVDPKLFADDFAELVGGLAQLANHRLAPGTELYLTTPEEERGVGEPVASVLARRLPAQLLGRGDDDTADAIRAAITLIRYTMRQVRMRMELHRQRAAARSAVDEALGGQQ